MSTEQVALRTLAPKKKRGLVLVMTGDGKGKTTAALGIAVRASGHGMRVCMIQFMKGSISSGEIEGLKHLSPRVELHLTGKGFCRKKGDQHDFSEHRERAVSALNLAQEKMRSGRFDILILDEINNAVHLGLVETAPVLALIDAKPPLIHLVLTGRDARPEVIAKADTATDMREIKHAYRHGIEPQPGIDY
jgi:cob(I)alamin adenosyltransferase